MKQGLEGQTGAQRQGDFMNNSNMHWQIYKCSLLAYPINI